ncbi:MAG: hypothetical protein KJ950_10055 [Proteobacteria bacterium]|nr:hypothetical protein [Pseudomonadota bacterium]MBU1687918.1 hypothetical protein [Pseudomonadota bacterium]
MSKKLITLLLAMAFTVSLAGVGMAAKSADCTVSSVDGSTVTLDCGKDADDLKVGSKVKVKDAKKKAVEGC